ncbi:hypothetical protein AVEN_213035-1 [Araneus ventricosus]|uniref:Secreted protein n=1 Tax=Araneus ventricosus TaxID=182803 RepID=A0A4Y2GW19_ARAVE|nr:hypothetical protein AVEN_18695-1 [Araneus ventricosus]GBM58202.1 hypothetical protein AVEN_213035-1 [Araneus ventricosus]
MKPIVFLLILATKSTLRLTRTWTKPPHLLGQSVISRPSSRQAKTLSCVCRTFLYTKCYSSGLSVPANNMKANDANNVRVKGRGGLEVRSQPLSRKAPGSKPDLLKIPAHVGLLHAKLYVVGQTSSRWCGAEVWKGGCQLRCRPRHLTVVKIAKFVPN